MKNHRFILLLPLLLLIGGCAAQHGRVSHVGHMEKVRTTAYTQTEPGGWTSACGTRLNCTEIIHSAAADWSRYPVGTTFRIMQTGEICRIEDYGSALVGTNTIDIFKDSRTKMRNWGVRIVDIKILQWGSPRRSLEILSPRAGHPKIRQMVLALREQTRGDPKKFRRIDS